MIKEENIVFIGGAPRSGTSLVQKVLNNHSKIYGGMEFDHLPGICNLYNFMKKGIENERQSIYYTENHLKKAVKELIENTLMSVVYDNEEVEIFSEKTPLNILVFDTLIELFPASKFIIVVRDPRAIINSMKKIYNRAKRLGTESGVGLNIMTDLNLIFSCIKSGNKFYLKHNNSCIVIYYEDLIRKSNNTVESICNFLNINFEEEMLNTENKNDLSNYLKSNKSNHAWYNSEMYDRKIDDRSLMSWTSELKKRDVVLTNYICNRHNYSLLKNYKFPKLNYLEKIITIPYIAYKKGIIKSFKAFINKASY